VLVRREKGNEIAGGSREWSQRTCAQCGSFHLKRGRKGGGRGFAESRGKKEWAVCKEKISMGR